MFYTGGDDEEPAVVNPDPNLPGREAGGDTHDADLGIPGDDKIDESMLG
jgi:hypothetical protein